MTKSIIQPSEEVINEALLLLDKYKSGEITPLKTRYAHFNMLGLGGLMPKSIYAIAGISGSGKTRFLLELEEDIFSINTGADPILIRAHFETPPERILLRKMASASNKSVLRVLYEDCTPQEQYLYDEIVKNSKSKNIFYIKEPQYVAVFLNALEEFLSEHKNCKNIVLSLDNIHLLKATNSDKKRNTITELMEGVNELKLRYNNLTVIIIAQLNRDIESRTLQAELAPRRSDIFNSDVIFHFSDLLVVRHNPFKLGHDKYMQLGKHTTKPHKYDHLLEWMDASETCFTTKDAVFYHYLKVRDIPDEEMERDLYIEHRFPGRKPEPKRQYTSNTLPID